MRAVLILLLVVGGCATDFGADRQPNPPVRHDGQPFLQTALIAVSLESDLRDANVSQANIVEAFGRYLEQANLIKRAIYRVGTGEEADATIELFLSGNRSEYVGENASKGALVVATLGAGALLVKYHEGLELTAHVKLMHGDFQQTEVVYETYDFRSNNTSLRADRERWLRDSSEHFASLLARRAEGLLRRHATES